MIQFDIVVKTLILLILAFILAGLIVAFMSIQEGYHAADTADDKLDEVQKAINWRKL